MSPLPDETSTTPGNVVPLGPVFISYRYRDGHDLAVRLAWTLRSAGVPVWHDEADMLPGDTTTRLQEALAGGLSGAILLVTPEIGDSEVVKNVEFPELIRLHANPDFTFVIANAIESPDMPGHSDRHAPGRLLGQSAETLGRIKQYPTFVDEACETIAYWVARSRMAIYRRSGAETLTIDLQTRSDPQAFAAQAGLVVRTIPPRLNSRAPSSEAWIPWKSFLRNLNALVEASGAREVRILGGAHLAAAFALGAALPETSRHPLAIQDQRGNLWSPDTQGPSAGLDSQQDSSEGARRPAAVFVDLVPSDPAVDEFSEFLKERSADFSGSLKIWLVTRRFLNPEEGAATAAEVAQRIRQFASRCGTYQIHLFLRVSFPLAILIGRLLNTLEITLYEIEEDTAGRRYIPSLTVASGRGGGPIVAIH